MRGNAEVQREALPGAVVTVGRHDVLASLACVIGCTETLLRWDEQLSRRERSDLLEIILRHANDLSERVRDADHATRSTA